MLHAGPEGDRRAALCAVAFERIGQCVLAALDKQPIDFAPFLPQFLRLYASPCASQQQMFLACLNTDCSFTYHWDTLSSILCSFWTTEVLPKQLLFNFWQSVVSRRWGCLDC